MEVKGNLSIMSGDTLYKGTKMLGDIPVVQCIDKQYTNNTISQV